MRIRNSHRNLSAGTEEQVVPLEGLVEGFDIGATGGRDSHEGGAEDAPVAIDGQWHDSVVRVHPQRPQHEGITLQSKIGVTCDILRVESRLRSPLLLGVCGEASGSPLEEERRFGKEKVVVGAVHDEAHWKGTHMYIDVQNRYAGSLYTHPAISYTTPDTVV